MAARQGIEELFKYGSTWVRADFHLHTRADSEFSYRGDEDHYLSSYVDALAAADIRVGVVTNHNKFDQDEFVALRKTAFKRGIFLLPGVELSVGDGSSGIHMNIVFSDAWLDQGQKHIQPFLSTMFPGKSEQQYQTENGRSDNNILQVVAELDKPGWDYFLVFAHVEDSKGLWEELKGRLGDWKDGRYNDVRYRTLGFQKVRTRDTRGKVKQWLGPWYPAEVEGSDCKSIDEIGKGPACFLKIGAFNFEAFEFALRDTSSRVTSEPIAHKRSCIKSILFEGGTLSGQELHFSPALNALIGIRGSGKSSIIEAIRYGLDIPFGEKAQDAPYKEKLIKHTFGSGGKITIKAVDGFGQAYEVRRIWDHLPEVLINGIQQPGVSIRDTVISKPLYFGQKDLSSSGEGFERDLVEKMLDEGVAELRVKIEEQKAKVQQAAARYKKLDDMAARKEEHTQKKQNAEFQMERYKKYGLEEKLQKQIDCDTDARKLDDIKRAVHGFDEALTALLAEHEDEVRNHLLYTSAQNSAFFNSYFIAYKKVIAQLDALVACSAAIKGLLPELGRGRLEFTGIMNSLKEEFAATERTVSEELKAAGIPAIRPDEFRQLSKTIEQAKAVIDELAKEETKADSIYKNLLSELSSLNELWHKEFTLIKAEMDKVNASNSSLSIHVDYKQDKDSFKSFLHDMMRGSNLRDTLFERIKDQFVDPIAIFQEKARAGEILGNNAPVFWNHFLDNMEAFLVYKVPNRFSITYKGKDLQEHSLGQRASALILFILSQKEHDVIIIDQPEDDLDNQTIYQDVIKLVRSLKQDTQFVFATHNPNFPVLGDAEMVVSCEYVDDRISMHLGSIDDKAVQERIVNIMEGGEEAFRRRKEIYDIWKPRNFSR
jgi:chromosome segregation protein